MILCSSSCEWKGRFLHRGCYRCRRRVGIGGLGSRLGKTCKRDVLKFVVDIEVCGGEFRVPGNPKH